MEVIVKKKFIRSSPRKMRLIVNLIKGQSLNTAKAQLKYLPKKAAKYVYQLLKSGTASCKEKDLDLEKCQIKNIICGDGPALKRRRIKERGRATAIRKRMSHLTLVLSDEKTGGRGQKNRETKEQRVLNHKS